MIKDAEDVAVVFANNFGITEVREPINAVVSILCICDFYEISIGNEQEMVGEGYWDENDKLCFSLSNNQFSVITC